MMNPSKHKNTVAAVAVKRGMLACLALGMLLVTGCSADTGMQYANENATVSQAPANTVSPGTNTGKASKQTQSAAPDKDEKEAVAPAGNPLSAVPTEGTSTKTTPENSKAPETKIPKTAKEAIKGESNRLKKEEKSFIGAVVKENKENEEVFPAALAEMGQETCDRLNFLLTADAGSIPAVLASKELSQADTAIKYLCPEFTPQLNAASAGFGDGTTDIGAGSASAVKPGTYVTDAKAETCTWSILGANGKILESGAPQDGATKTKLTIPAKAKSVTSTGCYAWLPTSG